MTGDAPLPMSFRNGTLSYSRFRVTASGGVKPPRTVEQSLLTSLAEHTLNPGELTEPKLAEFGFCGGRHVFDTNFDAPHNVYGDSLLFGLRIDTNKVPGDVKRAYRAMAETGYAADSSTGFLSRREKLAAKEDAEERCRRELMEGKYRRSKMIDIWWDLERSILLAPTFSDANVAGLRELFHDAFDLKLTPLSSGGLAYDILSDQGRSRDYEDLAPSVFGPRPSGGDAATESTGSDTSRPPVPWAQLSPEASDFVGNEFLLWLWWIVDAHDGLIKTSQGEVAVAIDRALDMECPWEVTGKQGLQADGPARSPEARTALKRGKWPRKAGLILAAEEEQFTATLQADRFILSGIKLARPEEPPQSPRELIELRLSQIRTLDEAACGLFQTFLESRCSTAWSTTRERMAGWITRSGRRAELVPTKGVVEIEIKAAPALPEAQLESQPVPDHPVTAS